MFTRQISVVFFARKLVGWYVQWYTRQSLDSCTYHTQGYWYSRPWSYKYWTFVKITWGEIRRVNGHKRANWIRKVKNVLIDVYEQSEEQTWRQKFIPWWLVYCPNIGEIGVNRVKWLACVGFKSLFPCICTITWLSKYPSYVYFRFNCFYISNWFKSFEKKCNPWTAWAYHSHKTRTRWHWNAKYFVKVELWCDRVRFSYCCSCLTTLESSLSSYKQRTLNPRTRTSTSFFFSFFFLLFIYLFLAWS